MRKLTLPLLLALGGAACLACESAPEPTVIAAEEPSEPPPPPPGVFSAERAWQDLEALVALGPRVAGTEGAEHARRYLRERLRAAGLDVEEVATPRQIEGGEEVVLRHVVATLPGASPQLFVLVAPYDSSHFRDFVFVGANDGASGAAVLLELARVLTTRSLPYTTRLVFLDGEGGVEGGGGLAEVPRWTGSRLMAEHMQEQGELEDVRLLVALNQVCDADLAIARDLSSQRTHREEFFRAAQRLGRVESFPRDRGFESPEASHLAFRERGVRATLALVDTRYGGDSVHGALAESADDTIEHCAADSLEAVGVVTLDALETIGRRLAKIDRFARTPLAGVGGRDEEGAPESDAGGGEEPTAEPPSDDAAAEAPADDPAAGNGGPDR